MPLRRNRILYICSSWPRGPVFGGQLRALHVARGLQTVGDVTVLYVGGDAADKIAMENTREEFALLPPISPVAAPRRTFTKKIRWALDTRYLDLHGVTASKIDQDRVNGYLDQFDLVWVLNSRTPNILQRWKWNRAHLDLDDIPSTYQRTVARSSSAIGQRCKARLQQTLLYRRERQFERRFTTLSVCSREDRAYLGSNMRVHIIPNGFERPEREPGRNFSPARPRIGFIGLYSYPPNLDGVRWFLKHCWPSIRNAVPDVRFRLIGKDSDGRLKPAEEGVDALGRVENAAAEIATWSAMIIPIRLGGGTRIKIAEAFSRKCPAVSTHLGAFGYDVTNGKEILLADEPHAFSESCIQLLQQKEFADGIAERAWTAFLSNWTWEAITPQIQAAAHDCLAGAKS